MKYVRDELKTIVNRYIEMLRISRPTAESKLDPVHREAESHRIKSGFSNLVLFALITLAVEGLNVIYNLFTEETLYCKIAMAVCYVVFLLFNVYAFLFMEHSLKDTHASDKKKELFTYGYWAVFTIVSSCIGFFETLSSGDVAHFFITVITLTVFVVAHPKIMNAYYFVSFFFESVALVLTKEPYDVFLICALTFVLCIAITFIKYSLYMSTWIKIKQFERIAEIDPLTNLLNRRGMQRSVDGIWDYCKTHSIPITLAMLDIDYFKKYNDKYGHAEGDECLKKIAACIRKHFSRRTDITCRFGGEEFIIIVAGDEPEKVLEYLKQFRKSIEELEIKSGCPEFSEYVTVSMGVYSTVIADGETFRDAVLNVDFELYRAKDKGRNCISYSCENT